MPARCCLCNGNGRCKSCKCVKVGTACVNCGPATVDRCLNKLPVLPLSTSQSTSSPLSMRHTLSTTVQANINTSQRLPWTPNSIGISDDEEPDHVLAQCDRAVRMTGETPRLNFSWGELDGTEFACHLDRAYDEIVHWRRNIFSVPSGSEGKEFVHELARLFQAWADASALQPIAIKAAMTIPSLLPTKKLKPKIIVNAYKDVLLNGRQDALTYCYMKGEQFSNTYRLSQG